MNDNAHLHQFDVNGNNFDFSPRATSYYPEPSKYKMVSKFYEINNKQKGFTFSLSRESVKFGSDLRSYKP